MKRTIAYLAISVLFLISCKDNEAELEEISIEYFNIELPSNWTFLHGQGYDSYVGTIETSDNQTIQMDLGWYSSNLPVDDQTHDIVYKVIDEKEGKVVHPKDYENGTTGVYFDDIDGEGTKLQLSGVDLSESNQRLFLRSIETLKFKKTYPDVQNVRF